jgi:hypothetical protein
MYFRRVSMLVFKRTEPGEGRSWLESKGAAAVKEVY